MGEEGRQFAQARLDILLGALESAGHVDQFVKVLGARLGAGLVLFVMVAQAGADDGVVHLFGQRQRLVAGERLRLGAKPCRTCA